MIATESYQRRVAEVLELTMKNDSLAALLKTVLACPTYSEQTNAIVVDAKTVAKIRDALSHS